MMIVRRVRFVRVMSGSEALQLRDLHPGLYTITATASGYETAMTTIELGVGEEEEVSLQLESNGLPDSPGGTEPASPQMQAGESPAESPAVGGMIPAPASLLHSYRVPPALSRAVAAGESGPVISESGAAADPGVEYQKSCALCHGQQGEGGIGPALAGS